MYWKYFDLFRFGA